MKYFRFVCDINNNSMIGESSLKNCIDEVSKYCSYLSRMYEYYFPLVKTDKVSTIVVHIFDSREEKEYLSMCTNIKDVSNFINLAKFMQMKLEKKSLYILDLCQQAIILLVNEMKWASEPFEYTYNKIISKKGHFCEHWRKPKLSPNKQLKAQIYFEDDYEKDGIFVDFTHKKGELLKRVKFSPTGFQIHSKSISELQWQDNMYIKIQRNFGCGFTEKSDYWIVGIDGSVEYHSPKAENTYSSPHGFFALGILLWEGKVVFEDKKKALYLIKKSAELGYKHGKIWIEKNIK